MKPTAPSGTLMVLMNGTKKSVSAGTCAVRYSSTAAARPSTDCQKYFQRAVRPRELPTTSFR